MCDIKLKTAHEQTRKSNKQTKTHRHGQHYGGYQRDRGGRVVKGKMGQVYVDDLTLGGEHTIQCTNHVS